MLPLEGVSPKYQHPMMFHFQIPFSGLTVTVIVLGIPYISPS